MEFPTKINDDNIHDLVNDYIENPTNYPNINSWDVSNVTNMSELFNEAFTFNELINDWNVSNVTNMSGMFADATSFNQPLNNWDVSKVINMESIFRNATKFNQPLDKWNVSNVTNLSLAFYGAVEFNQPLNSWNVSNVNNMESMFHSAYNFNQILDKWVINENTITNNMFFNSNITFEQSGITVSKSQKEQIDESIKYDICSICSDPLNNVNGPGPDSSRKCISNCNDVIIVCPRNHMFHRGCVLKWTKADSVDIAGQMGFTGMETMVTQQKRKRCPLCTEFMINDLETVPKVTKDELPKVTSGGKRKRKRKTKKYLKRTKTKNHLKRTKKHLKRIKKTNSYLRN